MRVAIIGAGLTGLTAAQQLTQAGVIPVIFDKGRGVGGRLATRRAEGGLQFDHGAQHLSAEGGEFAAFLEGLETAGSAARWMVDGVPKTVGLPGMTGVAKHLARGLDVRQGVEIADIRQTESGWQVAEQEFDRVILTVPAPQAIGLLGGLPLAQALQDVEMTPNLTLMVALPGPAPFVTRRNPDDDIAWIALDSDKPGRGATHCWVAQASTSYSTAHLELDKPQIAEQMLPLVCAHLEADPKTALYVSAHRWRYAQAAVPLGQPFVSQDGIFVGGDWALSAKAEGAWQSGRAMAQAVLASR